MNSVPPTFLETIHLVRTQNFPKKIFTGQQKLGFCVRFTQPAITCSKLAIETLEQGLKYVQSQQ